jgi:5'-nucleotidase
MYPMTYSLKMEINIKEEMMIIKIGIDLDSVLNNLNEKWLEAYNKVYNDKLTINDIHSWDMTMYVKPECGKKIYGFLNESLLETLTPLPDSIQVTKKLSEKHDLYIVTATHYKNVEVKVEWIKKYFPHINPSKIIICEDKNLINVDLLIDDAPHNILNFPKRTIVLDYAWNRSLPSNYPRAKNWNEIEQIINIVEFENEEYYGMD